MSDYDNTNRISIWGNDNREKETDSHYRGTVNIDGKEYRVNLWKRKRDANPKAPALSGTVKAKDEAHAQGMQQAKAAAQPDMPPPDGFADLESDIPFSNYEYKGFA